MVPQKTLPKGALSRMERPPIGREASGMTTSFESAYTHGFVRVAAAAPPVHTANPKANAAEIIRQLIDAHAAHAALLVCPELGLSAYAIDDLVQQAALLDAVLAALEDIRHATLGLRPILFAGAPLYYDGRLLNAVIAIHNGHFLGIIPKSFIPTYREFYEGRHFASGASIVGQVTPIGGEMVPIGTDLLFQASDLPDFIIHAEVCEDLWVPIPPSSFAALAGASVLVNLSASNATVGKADWRHALCRAQSGRCLAAYLYSAAGPGESTTDLAWDGQAMIYENGTLLAQTERFAPSGQMALADIDLGSLIQERMRQNTFAACADLHAGAKSWRRIGFTLDPPLTQATGLRRQVARFPFVPDDTQRLDEMCREVCEIQAQGLLRRLQATGLRRVVIGVSGGLDSTQALMIAVQVFDRMGLDRKDIRAFTLPAFATSSQTRANAWRLMQALGVGAAEIDVTPACRQMLVDLDHPFAHGEAVYDITFENVQAGARTSLLFRLANQLDAIVLGTGDLSELALGWCTYGVGDHMSHYNVNASVPKTLIQHLIRWIANANDTAVAAIASDILATGISPELVPGKLEGDDTPAQQTEALIGPYALHDFTLFHLTRYGDRPAKIAFLARHAWADTTTGTWPPHVAARDQRAYELPEIKHWLRVFLARFLGTSQFKRTALPNGPKVTAGGSLSPRGDWRAPSDSPATIWLDAMEQIP